MNIWSVILESFYQISCRFFTFNWFSECFEQVDRYINFPLLEKSVLHLCICCRRKGKSILMFVWLIEKISHSLSGIEHQVYLLYFSTFSSTTSFFLLKLLHYATMQMTILYILRTKTLILWLADLGMILQ